MLITHPVKRYMYDDYKNLGIEENTFLYGLINRELAQKSAPSKHSAPQLNLLFEYALYSSSVEKGAVEFKVPESYLVNIDDILLSKINYI